MENKKYYMDYELTTANGSTVAHRYIGDKEQIIEAIKIARANNYKIVKVDHFEEL